MPRSYRDKRSEARRLFLAGELETNAEIAARLKTKPHTIGQWRKAEDWDDLKRKIDRRAAEMFVEKIATDRVSLNVRHYRFWDLLVARLADDLKAQTSLNVRDLERIAAILDRAQKGQRLAKGMSVAGETEEQIRAESQAEIRRLIDRFIEAVKEHVPSEAAREKISRAVLDTFTDDDEQAAELLP